MSTNPSESNALPLTYRTSEVSAIGRCIRAGDSCSIVGVSGMAKSNLFRYLLKPDARQQYLGERWEHYLFLAVDAHELSELSERETYGLLHERLVEGFMQRIMADGLKTSLEQLYQGALQSTDTPPRHRAFVQSLRAVMTSDLNQHLVLLFDQFDEVYKTLSPHFFANLRSIRDEYKYRISYVVFTREELPRLCSSPESEEFYELFSANIIHLGPYRRDDALLLLSRVSRRYGVTISSEVSDCLIELTGGHPGLLKATCMAFLHDQVALPEETEQTIQKLLDMRDVNTECSKLWNSIDQDEQEVLRALVAGKFNLVNTNDAAKRLRFKSLVIDDGKGGLPFCPLFTRYISRQKTVRSFATKIQAGPIRVDTASEVWVNGRQMIPPLSKKELLLLEYLCLEPGQLRTKDEIIAVVYPDEYKAGGSITDDALNALVKRLRSRIEEHAGGSNRIITVRGKGYRLNTAP